MKKEALMYLLDQEYADFYRELTGRYPAYVPTSGDFYSGRTWVRIYV